MLKIEEIVNTVICGDCLETMKRMPDDSIDLTITSPPYDNLRDYKGYSFDFKNIAKELYRITKQGGVVVYVVGDATINGSETGTSFKQALYFKEIGFSLYDTMIYIKNNCPFPQRNRYNQIFEYMFVFSKELPSTTNILRRKNNYGSFTKITSYRQKTGETKKQNILTKTISNYGNVWLYDGGYQKSSKDKIAFKHPATFPEKLAQDHIISWSNKGDIVLDPMCGSGTTCKMAKKLGRKYIGMDISKEYCEIAKRRLMGVTEPLF